MIKLYVLVVLQKVMPCSADIRIRDIINIFLYPNILYMTFEILLL